MKYIYLILLSYSYGAVLNVNGEDYITIQSAIDDTQPGDTVLVNAGMYAPSTNGEIFPIYMVSDIHLIGAGQDVTMLNAQQTNRVLTIENCYNASISGFILTGGRPQGVDYNGGAIFMQTSNISISDVLIRDNTADSGGGIMLAGSSPTLTNVTIRNNTAEGEPFGQGGGIFMVYASHPTLENVTITNNTCNDSGGGIALYTNNNPILNNVVISNNTSSYGGGMWIQDSSPTLSRVAITGNYTLNFGGGIIISESSLSLINVTIADNIANENGGGILIDLSEVDIINSIMWGNSPYSFVPAQAEYWPDVSFSNIESATGTSVEGIGNIHAEPLFVDPENDDYSLQEGSPCIDAGIADLNGDLLDDITDYYGDYPDMGAFEFIIEDNEILPGDVNLDGMINVVDVVFTVNFILTGTTPEGDQLTAADMNQDGMINVVDIVQIVNIIMGG